ncbi:hypothetical protein PUNSTDRAFT_144312 [Punctularia strigosozonata HHB-11173 SS5]|uniref:uncharacterized protein n=1 Tax=Punctularia strigosozonata (strain HHB-11173) TaxID=741275 RepID=UPI00044180B2|nr:uncharacterized protein PUNSTDRAFT_144312 [Punctularia strigosozonata HHB-11173 SS5]EIN07774.1 hypothetical protein PUNSTDRAFT_144312 [Punctularia strigosozonata HHB-11173 SS5]
MPGPRRNARTGARCSSQRQMRMRVLETSSLPMIACLDVCLNKHTFKPTRVLCLGLGSPSSSRDARAQLAYLMHTVKWLEIEHSRVTVCDPVFTDDDRALFDETGIIHIQPTELEHELALNQPTLLYMPHCDRDLYERVYASNRSKRELGNLLLIGNELEAYATAGSKKELEQKAQQILKILPYLSSYLLPRSDAFYTAFQGTSVQIVSVDAAPPEFWEHEEPEKIDSVEAQVDAHTV